jgi:rare lipoprotein A
MVIKRKSRNIYLKSPLRIWILAGASSVALAAVVVTLSTPAVHADARLPRPAATAPPAAQETSATPSSPAPKKNAAKKTAKLLHGFASWYGGIFNGRHTASGERFDMNALTACHPSLPFGTRVRVVNLNNKQSVVVRITDRGELFEGRVIDLSYGAAKQLAMTKDGLAPVEIKVLSLGGSHSNN